MTKILVFVATSLAAGLTVGFGLGLWLLLSRVWGVTLLGANWLALVQVHGLLQLFGFAGLFAMGIALHALPRFRGAASPPAALVWIAYLGIIGGLALRGVAQPTTDLPARSGVLVVGGVLLCMGTLSFAYAALRTLATGRNPHRADELLIGAGICAIPAAAVLVAFETAGSASAVVAQSVDDRAIWIMLLGALATLIFGVWARVAPGFVAAVPANPRPLLLGGGLWLLGVLAQAFAVAAGPWLLLAGAALLARSIGVFGAGIARQSLHGDARLTRLGVRSAFVWLFVGLAILAAGRLGLASSYFQVSAARHALALGFVTLMIYAVASRVLPSFTGRRLWSRRLQALTLVVGNVGVALRVGAQLVPDGGGPGAAINGAAGILAYSALVLFAANAVRMWRSASSRPIVAGTPVPLELHFTRAR